MKGPRYRFERWVFDRRTGELAHRDGGVARLAPQPALVLSLLLERAGELVSRGFLRERVWPDTVVEFDKSLNFCISEIRAALGDSAVSPRFIETLPRRGYRFMGSVETVASDAGPNRRSGSRMPWPRPAMAYGIAVLAVLIATAGFALREWNGEAGTPSRGAREAAEMGGYLLTRGEGDDIERSVDFFREAVALSPGYARAYAGLGSAYLELSRVEEGTWALRRSIDLGPDQWAPHLTLALHALYTEYDPSSAGVHFEAALERAPDEVVVQHTYAWYRAATGHVESALEHMGTALELDPVSPRVRGDVGRLFYLAGRHDEAIAQCRRTHALTPEALRSRVCVVHALVQKGGLTEARSEAVAALLDQGADALVTSAVRGGTSSEGLEAYWRWAASVLAERAARGDESHVYVAAAWARAGVPDRAFAELEAALADRCPVLLQVELDPAFDPLRGDGRFQDLLRHIRGGDVSMYSGLRGA